MRHPLTDVAVATDAPPPPALARYAPTEAEVRRAVAVHAVHTVTYARAQDVGEARVDSMRQWYATLVIDAPPGEAELLKHFLRINQQHLDESYRINDLDDYAGYDILVGMADEGNGSRSWLGKSRVAAP